MVEYWPVIVAAAPAFVAWGDMRRSLSGLRKDVDDKVGRDTFAQIDKRLERIESQLDRLVERP